MGESWFFVYEDINASEFPEKGLKTYFIDVSFTTFSQEKQKAEVSASERYFRKPTGWPMGKKVCAGPQKEGVVFKGSW